MPVESPVFNDVEFAIQQAENYQSMKDCKCSKCQEDYQNLPAETIMLVVRILAIVENHPALCFKAIMEGWSIVKLIRVVNGVSVN